MNPDGIQIGYPSGLDDPIFPAMVRQEKVIFWPYDKSFIDQACLVKMGYMPTLPDYPGVSQIQH